MSDVITVIDQNVMVAKVNVCKFDISIDLLLINKKYIIITR